LPGLDCSLLITCHGISGFDQKPSSGGKKKHNNGFEKKTKNKVKEKPLE